MEPASSGRLLTEAALVLVLILLNGLFAMAEIALISVRKARLEQRANAGDSRAKAALELTASPERFLSTVQIGITLIGILTGAFSGATISDALAARLAGTPLAPYAPPIALGIVVVIITYFSLVLGELLPKRIALSHAEGIALFVAKPMGLLARFARPVVGLLSLSTHLGQRAMGLKDLDESTVTEEELRHLVRQAESSGELEEAERHILERVFHLNDLKVTALMVPRKDAVWLDLHAEPGENWKRVAESGYSSFLVCEDSIDNVRGMVHITSLWEQRIRTGNNALDELIKPPLYFPDGLRALTAIEKMKSAEQTFAVVMDEFGGVSGIVTLNDLVSNVFWGTRMDLDPNEDHPVRREDGSWLVPGGTPMHEFHALLGIVRPADEAEHLYDTVGGLVMTKLGSIPTTGATVEYAGYRLEVVDMDGLRVDQVLLQKIAAEPASAK
jgi:putative hemolysin